jgi:hypothetical protein
VWLSSFNFGASEFGVTDNTGQSFRDFSCSFFWFADFCIFVFCKGFTGTLVEEGSSGLSIQNSKKGYCPRGLVKTTDASLEQDRYCRKIIIKILM